MWQFLNFWAFSVNFHTLSYQLPQTFSEYIHKPSSLFWGHLHATHSYGTPILLGTIAGLTIFLSYERKETKGKLKENENTFYYYDPKLQIDRETYAYWNKRRLFTVNKGVTRARISMRFIGSFPKRREIGFTKSKTCER